MAWTIDRRQFVRAGGLAALAAVGGAANAEHLTARGFTHGVASGEPGQNSLLFWTRFVTSADATDFSLAIELSDDAEFTRTIAGGEVRTGAYRDWTAKITVDGLNPGKTYWYRFVGPDGSRSPVGQAKTLPDMAVGQFDLGLFSCSHRSFGWFNAYGHAAARPNLDLWLHVGDYIYEDGDVKLVSGRSVEPVHETLALADYRLRYACYRADPDLQALHRRAAMIALWDDHEVADDSWQGGARHHLAATHGAWDIRRASAIQAYYEWMPVSEEPWKAYRIGGLATLYRTESRLLARTRQISVAALPQPDDTSALSAFRDGPWRDPSATMLGSAQEAWLRTELHRNAQSSAWQLLGMATNVGLIRTPPAAIDWLPRDTKPIAVANCRASIARGAIGLPSSFDNWGGYPAARSRLLGAAQAVDADLVLLTGDSHNAWAFSLIEDGRPAGVEIGGHSVTSPGMERTFAAPPSVVAGGYAAMNPELEWMDSSQRGYTMINLTREKLEAEWLFLEATGWRTTRIASRHRKTVQRHARKFEA